MGEYDFDSEHPYNIFLFLFISFLYFLCNFVWLRSELEIKLGFDNFVPLQQSSDQVLQALPTN